MKQLVEISLDATGYYSGQTYHKTIYMLKEDYDKFKDVIFEINEVYVGELDGKHSQVYGDVSINLFLQEDVQLQYKYKMDNDGEKLYYRIKDDLINNGLIKDEDEFEEIVNKAYDYISNLDSLITVSITLNKSQKEKLEKLVSVNGWEMK